MILHFPKASHYQACRTNVPLLDDLLGFWEEQRGNAAAPSADSLFISVYSREMPHLMLGYLVKDGFRVEFTGEVVRHLVGCDIIGEHLSPDATHLVLVDMARDPYMAHHHFAPQVTRHEDHIALHLPYANARGEIAMIMSAMWEVGPATEAEIVPFSN